MFYILCIERTAQHQQLFWWKPNLQGYTTDLDKAGKYDFKAMIEIIRNADGGDVAIKCKTLDDKEE